MIKATDLRIGNTVFVDWVDAGRKTETCFGIHQGPEHNEIMMSTVTKGYWVPLIKVQAIPLTAETLIDLGAKGRTNLLWLPLPNLKSELHFECHNSGEIKTTIKGQFSDLILDRIYFVHQLQNLYYTLTRQELSATKPQTAGNGA